MDLTAGGVTDAASIKRVRKASNRMQQLQASGVCRPRVDTLGIVRSYAIHLTPYTSGLGAAAEAMLDRATRWMYPRLKRHSRTRARRLLGVLDPDIVRKKQQRSMYGRIAAAHEAETGKGLDGEREATSRDAQMAAMLASADASLLDPDDEQLARWAAHAGRKLRKGQITGGSACTLHPLWKLPTTRHATCIANWLFGRFPNSTEAAQWVLGAAAYEWLDERLLRTYMKAEWSGDDRKVVIDLLEHMSSFWPVPLKV